MPSSHAFTLERVSPSLFMLGKVADWIVNNPNNVLAPYSTGMERLVKARCLLREERYYELLAWLGQSEELFRSGNMWFVLLDNFIYSSRYLAE